MDYVKFVRKNDEALISALEGRDKIFVIGCGSCFDGINAESRHDFDEVLQLVKDQGKTVTGSIVSEFLCNETRTDRVLADNLPEGTETILVVSCGLGIQNIAKKEEDIPVLAATDTRNFIGHHGMALTQKTCGACAQCYLNLTGGICPITDCTKSLVNGQCGGAKNGKCEIDPNKDCAWEKIEQRLKEQGRLEELAKQPVQLRDYSAVSKKQVREYVDAVRAERAEGFHGGIHPSEKKNFTEGIALVKFPEPETVVIPTSMHAGAPANPVVKAGDTVKVGQLIAEAAGYISCNVHSSVSGTVVAVEPRPVAGKGDVMSIVIKSDMKDTLDESVRPAADPAALTPDEIIDIVRDKGIAGMGGAGFPTYVKLKPGKPIDTVLINGSECEPYLTADHRVLLEYADDVIYGLQTIMKAVSAPKGVILIEDNKADAIELMQAKTADLENIEICVAKTQYPEGAEKMLIKRVLNRMVPSGGLPADVGCVVSNVSTAKAIADAVLKGMPLVERVVTVSGEHIAKPGNFMVKIGTNAADLVSYCGGTTGKDFTFKMGGPMMGTVLTSTDVPIVKGSNGIIAVDTKHSEPTECIRCGRCVDVCPMELTPMLFSKYVDEKNAYGLKALNIMDCMSCGCCGYICAARIPFSWKIAEGKNMVRALSQK